MKRSRIGTGTVLGAWLLATAVWVAQFRVSAADGLGDLPVYEHAARLMRLGAVPYRDFALEYPPAAAGLFGVTGLLPGGYQAAFSGVMLGCLLVTVAGVVATMRALGRTPPQTALAALVVALSPALLGSLAHTRYDLVLSAVLAWLAYCMTTGRWAWAWALVGAALLIKLVPIVLVPLMLVAQHRRHPMRAMVRSMVPGALLATAGLLPFALIAPDGLWQSVAYHLRRPLQVESLGSSVLLAVQHLGGPDVQRVRSYGSDNLAGSAPDLLAGLSGVAGALIILAVAAHLHRLLRRHPEASHPALIVQAMVCTVVAFVATGKVLSPQYMLWLLPLVPLIEAPRAHRATGVLAVALVLSHEVFPTRYRALTEDLAALPSWLVVARNALLCLLVVLAWPRATPDQSTRDRNRWVRSWRGLVRTSSGSPDSTTSPPSMNTR